MHVYIHTHTHTHKYIHIYSVYISVYSCDANFGSTPAHEKCLLTVPELRYFFFLPFFLGFMTCEEKMSDYNHLCDNGICMRLNKCYVVEMNRLDDIT